MRTPRIPPAVVLWLPLLAGCVERVPSAPVVPPLRVEVVPPSPEDGLVWQPGHWQWTGAAYKWAPGSYVGQPAGARWMQGRWAWYLGEWLWIPGHWA